MATVQVHNPVEPPALYTTGSRSANRGTPHKRRTRKSTKGHCENTGISCHIVPRNWYNVHRQPSRPQPPRCSRIKNRMSHLRRAISNLVPCVIVGASGSRPTQQDTRIPLASFRPSYRTKGKARQLLPTDLSPTSTSVLGSKQVAAPGTFYVSGVALRRDEHHQYLLLRLETVRAFRKYSRMGDWLSPLTGHAHRNPLL